MLQFWEFSQEGRDPGGPTQGPRLCLDTEGMCGSPAWALLCSQLLHEHMVPRGTLAAVPQQWVSSLPLASHAQPEPSLCQQTGVLAGNLPGPQSHSQTPAAPKLRMYPLPFSLHSLHSWLSHPRGPVLSQPHTPLPRPRPQL